MVPSGFRLRTKFLSRISFVLVRPRAGQEKLARFVVFPIPGRVVLRCYQELRRFEQLHEVFRTEVGNNDRTSERSDRVRR